MSGHSKWSQIKHKKGASDAKRGQLFTKLGKNISLLAKDGVDPEMNSALRTAITQARAANMPSDNINKAILKGSGQIPGAIYEEVRYEGYGPGGVAFIVECVTDNSNRTVSAVRSTFTKSGGSLGASGSVTYLFNQKGVFRISQEDFGERTAEAIELLGIDAGADDIETSPDGVTIYTTRDQFGSMMRALEAAGIRLASSGLEWIAIVPLVVDRQVATQVEQLHEALEDDDDVQAVYTSLAG